MKIKQGKMRILLACADEFSAETDKAAYAGEQ